MTQIVLSDDLIEITAEINIYKQQAGQAVFEIGKRLKHVKETDLAHGQWLSWLESVDIAPRTAQKMMQAYEHFGNTPSTTHLGTGKIFELLSLPDSVDKQSFISEKHEIPSTGESKTAMEMTQKQLREVTQQLKEAEARAAHNEKLWSQAKNQPPRVETRTVEVIPEHTKRKLEQLEFDNSNLKRGYQDSKERLQQFELRNTVEFDAEEAQKQREKLQHEADINALQICVHVKNFIEKAAITSFMEGALAAADPITKRRVMDSVDMIEKYARTIKLAVNGRILGGVINE